MEGFLTLDIKETRSLECIHEEAIDAAMFGEWHEPGKATKITIAQTNLFRTRMLKSAMTSVPEQPVIFA